MTHFEKLLGRNILFIYFRNCVTSDDQESMTDTVLECMTKKLLLLLKLHDQVLFLASLKHTHRPTTPIIYKKTTRRCIREEAGNYCHLL